MQTIDLKQVMAVFRKADQLPDEKAHAGKVSRFVVELVGEDLHTALFARFLSAMTGVEHQILDEEPKYAGEPHLKRLDRFVVPCHNSGPMVIYACEVKSWNDNGRDGWYEKKKGDHEPRAVHYTNWLTKNLPINDALSKLGRQFGGPRNSKLPDGAEVQNALLIYHPLLASDSLIPYPGDATKSAFWTKVSGKNLLVFSGENYIKHLIEIDVSLLKIESPSLEAKIDRIKRLFPEP